MLDWPTKATLTPLYPTSGPVRAWITETYKPVSTTKTDPIGSGVQNAPQTGPFRSYIGHDRIILRSTLQHSE